MSTALWVRAGDRIEVTGILPNDPAPLPVGLRGVVRRVSMYKMFGEEHWQISVDWDDGRTLMLLEDDPFRVIREAWTMNDLQSPDDLEAVPVGAVIIDRNLKVWKKVDESDMPWQTIGDDTHFSTSYIRLGARTIY